MCFGGLRKASERFQGKSREVLCKLMIFQEIPGSFGVFQEDLREFQRVSWDFSELLGDSRGSNRFLKGIGSSEAFISRVDRKLTGNFRGFKRYSKGFSQFMGSHVFLRISGGFRRDHGGFSMVLEDFRMISRIFRAVSEGFEGFSRRFLGVSWEFHEPLGSSNKSYQIFRGISAKFPNEMCILKQINCFYFIFCS